MTEDGGRVAPCPAVKSPKVHTQAGKGVGEEGREGDREGDTGYMMN